MDTAAQINFRMAPYGRKLDGSPHLPNPTQQKVLDWVDSVREGKQSKVGGIPTLYLQGGVGSGKTRAILVPCLELLEQTPNLRILWGRQDYNDLKTSIIEVFLEVVPDEIILDKNEAYHWFDIAQTGTDKARIYFNGLKDLSGLGSKEFGVILVSEVYEISLTAFRTLKYRARQANMPTMILMEGNPPNEDHWLNHITNPLHPDYDADVEMWQVSSYENWNNLPLTYRNSLETMPNSWKSKYLFGKFGFTPDGTPFYAGFREQFHKKQLTYNSNLTIYRSWDFGFHHPAVSFHQIDSKGRWIILKEILGSEITTLNFGEYVKIKCKEYYPTAIFEDYCDPAGNQVSSKNELTDIQILNSIGIFPSFKFSTYAERKAIIERKLSIWIEESPSLVIDESCKIIIDGLLGGYHYPVKKQGQSYNPKLFEVPFKDGYYEHLCNTIEYFAINHFTGAETKPDKDNVTYKIIGDLKDIHYDIDEQEDNYSNYHLASKGQFTVD